MTFISRSWFPPQYECCQALGKSRGSAKRGLADDVLASASGAHLLPPCSSAPAQVTPDDSLLKQQFGSSLPKAVACVMPQVGG